MATRPSRAACRLATAVLTLACLAAVQATPAITYAPFVCPALSTAAYNTAPCYTPGDYGPYAPLGVTCVQYTRNNTAVRECVSPPAGSTLSAFAWASMQDPAAICYAGLECQNDEVTQVGDYGVFTCNGSRCLAQAGDGQPMCVAYAYQNMVGSVGTWVNVVGCVGGYVVNTATGAAPAMMVADANANVPLYQNLSILDLGMPEGYHNAAAGWAPAGALLRAALAGTALVLLAPAAFAAL